VMLASQAVKFGLTIVSAAILARLLTPEDYGLIAMVTVVSTSAIRFAASVFPPLRCRSRS